MSIQNDVEKLYRSDLEKQRQKQKKKKKKKLLGIMLIVIIIAALILIMQYLKKALTDDGREFTETVLDNSALDNSMADTTSEAAR